MIMCIHAVVCVDKGGGGCVCVCVLFTCYHNFFSPYPEDEHSIASRGAKQGRQTGGGGLGGGLNPP